MGSAIVFPGQGSQTVGMLSAFTQNHAIIKSVFGEASERLDFDLWLLIQNGPKDELDKTENTQPAMLACGVALWKLWRQAGGIVPDVLAGHSLGEYTALVAAGALNFGDAVTLVRDRGRYMQQAVPAGEGAMAAILGLTDEQVMEICALNSVDAIVSVANFNSPGQAVIAGHTGAVAKVMDDAKTAGAKRVIMLDVSVPSHCRLMQSMTEKYSQRLAELKFSDADIPVVQNADTVQRTDSQAIKNALLQQLHQPVRWTDTILKIKALGITNIIECGPGKVLTGLIKRIDRELTAYPVFDFVTLATALTAVTE